MKVIFILMLIVLCLQQVIAQDFEKEIINTSKGELEITFIGHGTLMMKFKGKNIHIDHCLRPWA